MTSSEFRAEARRNLQGKWGKVALTTLAFVFVAWVISFIIGLMPDNLAWLFEIVELVIEIPLGFGFIFLFLKIFNNEETGSFDFLSLGFENFGKSWGVTFRMFLKMIVPIVLLIISYIIMGVGIVGTGIAAFSNSSLNSGTDISAAITGGSAVSIIGAILVVVSYIFLITKSYYYQLAYLIAMENPNMSSADCVQKSEDMMKGNRAKLFFLQLSFIGWFILGALSLGIGLLWIIPYSYFAEIAFYKYFLEKNSGNIEVQSQPVVDSNPEITSNDNDNPIQKL